jgi:protein tyrosine phosphatase (PTP) superfamily phosphohydrolase (DUF442 family)
MENDFKIWFENKLSISGYPNVTRLANVQPKPFDVMINVSDEFYFKHSEALSEKGFIWYWFPLAQKSKDMGMISIFGALQVLYKCYNADKSVLLHCRKGSNRSQVVKAAFYYLITETHLSKRNMLLYNCQTKHLPEKEQVEKWLLRCKQAFVKQHLFKGNMLDWTFKELETLNVHPTR